MSKYKIPEDLVKFKPMNNTDRQKIRDKIINTIYDLFADTQLPMIKVECSVSQGITEYSRFLEVEIDKVLNGTFTITIEVNGGCRNILEEDIDIKIMKRRFFHGRR
jgi:hypothetical protein